MCQRDSQFVLPKDTDISDMDIEIASEGSRMHSALEDNYGVNGREHDEGIIIRRAMTFFGKNAQERGKPMKLPSFRYNFRGGHGNCCM